ncbi:MAG: Hsp70 family protein [Chloroflexi bacterium]|nr:Hsp70 family protein [Chloroflexota bacterium]
MKRLYAIGVDFGTSNSCICLSSYRYQTDGQLSPRPLQRPEPVTIQLGETVPTAIFVGTDQEPTVYGRIAEEKASFNPERIRNNFKLDLGAPGLRGAEAYGYARDFFGFLKGEIGDLVPFDSESDDIEIATNIGHPVQWTADQRRLTLRAAAEAGFPNCSLEDETSAAIFGHLCEQQLNLPPGQRSRILVVDMGGGTTDFAFVELPAELNVPPETTPVDPHPLVAPWDGKSRTYGGRDIDLLLLRHFAGPLGYTEQSRHWPFLLRETRRFKEQFSNAASRGQREYSARWIVEENAQEVRLSREDFERLTSSYRNHLPRLFEAALALEGLTADRIDAVVLTGGSSQWYWVEEAVRTVLPHISFDTDTLVRHSSPEQSVARGLAYRWMIEGLGGRPRPRRRAAHGIWVEAPTPLPVLPSPGESGNGVHAPASESASLVQVMDRGQLLPFITPDPMTLAIEKVDNDASTATLQLKLYTGSSEASRQELFDQVATFRRTPWEALLKRVSRFIPWSTSFDRDRFEVAVLCSVDESELFLGRVTITRFLRGRPAQEVVHILETVP